MKCASWITLTTYILLFLAPSSCAGGLDVVDLYADLQSCEVTTQGTDENYLLEVNLISPQGANQSRSIKVNGPGTWVISWDTDSAAEGSYKAMARLHQDGKTMSCRSYDFHQGGRVPLRFDVRDFKADQKGLSLLVHSDDMAVVDIYYMLIKNDKALYICKDPSVSLSSGTSQLSYKWKGLLEKDTPYQGRIRIVERRNNQTRAFMSPFLAIEDADITETYEDGTGASATIIGRSAVPFQGYLKFDLYSNESFMESVHKRCPVLLDGDDETVEIAWEKVLEPGIFRLKVGLFSDDNSMVDFRETILEAKFKPSASTAKISDEQSPIVIELAAGIIVISVLFAGGYLIYRRRRS